MTRTLLAVTLTFYSCFGFADEPDELVKKMCGESIPWVLPKVQAPFSVSEVYLSLNGSEDKTMRICHCTSDVAENTLYIWVRAQKKPEPAPRAAELETLEGVFSGGSSVASLLRGRGCLDVRGKNIVIHHRDTEQGRWGTYVHPVN